MTTDSAPDRVPVLIVGGGVVGLSASLFLLHHGVRSLLVERHPGTSIHPRSRGINARSGEIFRQIGLFEEIQAAGSALQPAIGAYAGETLRHAIEPLPRRAADAPTPSFATAMGRAAELTPTPNCRCTQDIMEPVLRARAVERGADIRFNVELESFEQDEDGVTATIVERDSGVRRKVRCDYMIAADGVKGKTRERLGIGVTGSGALGNLLNVLLRVDLSDLVRGREFSQCLVENDEVRALWAAIDNHSRWTLHIVYKPERGESTADFPPNRCAELARRALGLPSPDIEVLGVVPWQPSVRVADRFKQGRVFLAGDAAHQMPPQGGQGANSGIAEVHNLAWKIAAVASGAAAPSLLDTYDVERRPVGLYAAERSGALVGRDGLPEVGPGGALPGMKKLGVGFFTGLGYAYNGGETPMVDAFDGKPGTRAPHAWVEVNGERCSTLDLFGKGWVLLARGTRWNEAARETARRRRCVIRVVTVGASGDVGGAEAWTAQMGLGEDEAVLVRPDGYVAWRSSGGSEDDPGQALDGVLAGVLGR
jgi:putative polyketide hydroxylase